MVRTVNMLKAKSTLSQLVEAVESGAEKEIIIARNGKPAARLVPMGDRPLGTNGVRLGLLEGQFPAFTLEEFNALDKEIEDLFYASPIFPDEPPERDKSKT